MATTEQLEAIENSGIEGRGVTRNGGIIVEIPPDRVPDFLTWLQGVGEETADE